MNLKPFVLGLLVLSVAAAFWASPLGQTANADEPPPAPARLRFTLNPGEISRTIPAKTASGEDILLTISQEDASKAPIGRGFGKGVLYSSTTYGKYCSMSMQSTSPFPLYGSWKVSMQSLFYYDYSSVWHVSNPVIAEDFHVFPASTSGLQSYNSPWSQTVVFGEGRFNWVWNLPYPGFASEGHHMWIQEDAWGNCTYFAD